MNIEYILKEHFKVDKVCFKSGKFTKEGERALENLCNLLQSLSLLGVEIDYKQAIEQINRMTNNGTNARL